MLSVHQCLWKVSEMFWSMITVLGTLLSPSSTVDSLKSTEC